MAIIGAACVAPQDRDPAGRRARLPAAAHDGAGRHAVAGLGVVLLALFTYSPGDPSLNHATGRAPPNTMGVPGA